MMRKITSKELALIEDKFMKSLQEEDKTEKDTKSMYLCGEVGTGKTYFAKKFKFVEKKVVIKTPHSINKSITLQEIIKSVFIN
jgi:predicted ATPase